MTEQPSSRPGMSGVRSIKVNVPPDQTPEEEEASASGGRELRAARVFSTCR